MAHVNRARQPEPYPDPPMGSLVEKMEIHSDGPLSARNNDTRDYVGISDVELIASYNWIDTPRPEIMIPGK